MFKRFVNPANGKYAWVSLEECEVAYMNDFRWSSEMISWSDFLLLMEVQTVHLPRPKNTYATDLCVSHDKILPIFATGISPVEYISKYNARDERESSMMATPWKVLEVHHQIPINGAKTFHPVLTALVFC